MSNMLAMTTLGAFGLLCLMIIVIVLIFIILFAYGIYIAMAGAVVAFPTSLYLVSFMIAHPHEHISGTLLTIWGVSLGMFVFGVFLDEDMY